MKSEELVKMFIKLFIKTQLNMKKLRNNINDYDTQLYMKNVRNNEMFIKPNCT